MLFYFLNETVGPPKKLPSVVAVAGGSERVARRVSIGRSGRCGRANVGGVGGGRKYVGQVSLVVVE